MTHTISQIESLHGLVTTSPEFRLLRSDHVVFSVSVFNAAFRGGEVASLPESEFLETLKQQKHLIKSSELEIQTPREINRLIVKWCEQKFIKRREFKNMDEAVIELVPSITRLLLWFKEMMRDGEEAFVGTESRFSAIIQNLELLVEDTTNSPEERIKILEECKRKIDNEIQAVKRGEYQASSRTMNIERFDDVIKDMLKLLSEFDQVEENFKNLTLDLSEKAILEKGGRGKILGSTLEAVAKIENSHQGLSFAGFREKVNDTQLRQILNHNIKYALALPEIQEYIEAGHISNDEIEKLRSMRRRLKERADRVFEKKRKLNSELYKHINTDRLQNAKSSAHIIEAIEALLIQNKHIINPKDKIGDFPGSLDYNMPFDYPLFEYVPAPVIREEDDLVDEEGVSDDGMTHIQESFLLDTPAMRANIFNFAKDKHEFTMKEFLNVTTLRHGMMEAIKYRELLFQEAGLSFELSPILEQIFFLIRESKSDDTREASMENILIRNKV